MSANEVVGIGSAWVNRVVHCSVNRLQSLGIEPGAVIKVDRQQYRELCAQIQDVFQYAGGSVANTLVALSRLKRSVGFVGKSSQDGDGLFFLNDLVANGVNILLQPSEVDLATSGCLYQYSNPTMVTKVVHLGASKTLGLSDMSMSDVVSARYLLIEADILDMPRLHEWLATVVDMAKKSNTDIVLVLSNKYVVARHREFLMDLMGCVDMVAGNEVEFEALLNTQSQASIVRGLSHFSLRVLMTQSANGAIVLDGGCLTTYGAYPCEFVDATAAGDYYLAGFLHAMLDGQGVEHAATMGSMAAAEVCSVRGSRCSQSLDFTELVCY
jgi:sugar/nucleoside kinase (ribokinase family)